MQAANDAGHWASSGRRGGFCGAMGVSHPSHSQDNVWTSTAASAALLTCRGPDPAAHLAGKIVLELLLSVTCVTVLFMATALLLCH